MAYISAEDVKSIRTEIRKQYPSKEGWKFSVRKLHSSEISVSILTAPINLDPKGIGHDSVNDFYIAETYKDSPEIRDVLLNIKNIIETVKVNYDSNANDPYADYANYNYFIDISIGEWDKPFKQVIVG